MQVYSLEEEKLETSSCCETSLIRSADCSSEFAFTAEVESFEDEIVIRFNIVCIKLSLDGVDLNRCEAASSLLGWASERSEVEAVKGKSNRFLLGGQETYILLHAVGLVIT